MAALNQEAVLGFLLQAGGKVKNSELLTRFKPLLDSPNPGQRAANRELFKGLVNGLAVVKDEEGVKIVVLKKKYQHLLEEGAKSPAEAPLASSTRGQPTKDPEEPPLTSSTRGQPAKDPVEPPLTSSTRGQPAKDPEQPPLTCSTRVQPAKNPEETPLTSSTPGQPAKDPEEPPLTSSTQDRPFTKCQDEAPQTSSTAEPPPTRSEEASTTKSLQEGPQTMNRGEATRRPRERVKVPEEGQVTEGREAPLQCKERRGSRRGSEEGRRSSLEVSSPRGYMVSEAGSARSVRRVALESGGECRLSLGALDEYQLSQGTAAPSVKNVQQLRRRSLDLLEQNIDQARAHSADDQEGSSQLQGRESDGNLQDPDQKRESVFALVAKLDNSGPAPIPLILIDADAKRSQRKDPTMKPYNLPLRCPPQPVKGQPEPSIGQGEDFLKNKEKFGASLSPDMPPPKSPCMRRRQYEETGARSPHLKRVFKALKVSEENRFSNVVPLESAEHDWLVKSTAGRWNHHLYGLVLKDAGLVEKKDFMSGFTALHWAAKSGNSEMLTSLIVISKENGLSLDVNTKSFGGYTPLHVAAIHGREEVILKLVREHAAKVHLRDWSGKKAHHYLHKGASSAVRHALDDPNVFNTGAGIPVKRNSKLSASIVGSTSAFLGILSEDLPFHDLTKGLKKPASLNKLFSVPAGQKKKPKTRGSFASFSSLQEDGEDDPEDTVGKPRPRSEFYSH